MANPMRVVPEFGPKGKKVVAVVPVWPYTATPFAHSTLMASLPATGRSGS